MEEIRERKRELRNTVAKLLDALSAKERAEKTKKIESRVFEFANFLEAKVPLLYIACLHEVPTEGILKNCLSVRKAVILPTFEKEKHKMKFMKADNLDTCLKPGPRGIREPDPARCKPVPIERIDIAVVPGIAFDEKGARLGTGEGYYDRLIPKLPSFIRKVSLAFECQIVPQIPMQSHDKYVDIIITDERIIYKI
ncbi:MAG: 5-formyltetrahydrofolate cyclo-ligase [Desulfobacteraceae bacterium IS3]|nr:MAG: 5-formyltetrahydrofolate cyclo-ligase [Desulfobacteraceae bacterium IS3]